MSCDHKFIGSLTCLKCGWGPPVPADKVVRMLKDARLTGQVELEKDLRACWRSDLTFEQMMLVLDQYRAGKWK